jgi:hypothetical protein
MIKHNDTTASSINVLAEGELDQVVGGCGRGHRRGYGYGGWGGKHGYDKGGYDKSTDKSAYEPSSYEEPSYGSSGYGDSGSGDNVVVNNNNITLDINIQQVAG